MIALETIHCVSRRVLPGALQIVDLGGFFFGNT